MIYVKITCDASLQEYQKTLTMFRIMHLLHHTMIMGSEYTLYTGSTRKKAKLKEVFALGVYYITQSIYYVQFAIFIHTSKIIMRLNVRQFNFLSNDIFESVLM